MSKAISLRPATIEDVEILLGWRNDVETRRVSHRTSAVTMEEHVKWLSTTLSNANRKLLVAEKGDIPVGVLRADQSDGVWELSWTVAPGARGQGIAKRMVALLAAEISEPIRAEIKACNIASARVAEYAGMVLSREVDGILHFSRAALE